MFSVTSNPETITFCGMNIWKLCKPFRWVLLMASTLSQTQHWWKACLSRERSGINKNLDNFLMASIFDNFLPDSLYFQEKKVNIRNLSYPREWLCFISIKYTWCLTTILLEIYVKHKERKCIFDSSHDFFSCFKGSSWTLCLQCGEMSIQW